MSSFLDLKRVSSFSVFYFVVPEKLTGLFFQSSCKVLLKAFSLFFVGISDDVGNEWTAP